MFKNYSRRLYSTKSDTRINEIIQLISNTKTFNTALTHKSYTSIDPTAKSYDTIEFLGDALLENYVSLFLYFSYPDYSEGRLTNERCILVSTTYLGSISLEIGLYKYLRLGKEKQNIDFTSKSLSKGDKKILADIFESFIAALLMEKGNKLLLEFLSLTIFKKGEFKALLNNFNNVIVPKLFSLDEDMSVVKDTVANIIISKEEDNISYPTSENNYNEVGDKIIVYIDKLMKNQDEIIQLLVKMYVLMEYNYKKVL